jgi:hypothetical protein
LYTSLKPYKDDKSTKFKKEAKLKRVKHQNILSPEEAYDIDLDAEATKDSKFRRKKTNSKKR